MDDRSLAFREMFERDYIRETFKGVGVTFDVQQSYVLQLCVDLAKSNPELSIRNIIDHVCERIK